MRLLHMQREIKWTNESQFRNAREAFHYWAQIWLLNRFACRLLQLDVQWSGPMPSGPKIFAGNHPTTTDPFFLLAALREKTRMMVNADIFQKPVLGGLMRRGGHIPVDKRNGLPALEAGLDALSRGDNLGIFPEGSLSNIQDGIKVNKLKTGAVRMALKAGVPLIPVGFYLPVGDLHIRQIIVGGDRVESRLYLRGRYAITFGRPLWISGDIEDREHVQAMSDHLRERIYHLSQVSSMRLRNNHLLSKTKRRKKKKSALIESGR